MLVPALRAVERRRHLEDRDAALRRAHAPGRERAPVADALHAVEDGLARGAPEEEGGVQRMRREPRSRPPCGDERLCDDLTAVDAAVAVSLARAAEVILPRRLEIEAGEEPRGQGGD